MVIIYHCFESFAILRSIGLMITSLLFCFDRSWASCSALYIIQAPFVLEAETGRMVGLGGCLTRMEDTSPVSVTFGIVNLKTYHAQPMGRRKTISCLPRQAKEKEATVHYLAKRATCQISSSQLQPQIYLLE
ncbi:hypothetical protein M758_3G022600 [Ceratodon purpureus]|uniref:Uncharacterized protein n=1 Tax=Ceratodon purpureus TaxID=3225 RepID=A0A8T0IHD1_CERPU|nr:hypothetical protein KC19_3G022400 [Ceratodon purpureus]KAG0621472.1 hypothetical protein M758_3G022600 [Ceratodon purpureus]